MKFIFAYAVYLQSTDYGLSSYMKVIESRSTVKVTGAEMVEHSYFRNVKLLPDTKVFRGGI